MYRLLALVLTAAIALLRRRSSRLAPCRQPLLRARSRVARSMSPASSFRT